DGVLKKTDGGVLLEIKTAVHRSAHVDQQAEMQWQIGFPAKINNGLRRLVIVENREIVLVQIADKFAVLVGGDEQNVHLVHTFVDGEHRTALRIVLGSGRVGADCAAGVRMGKSGRCAGQGESGQ